MQDTIMRQQIVNTTRSLEQQLLVQKQIDETSLITCRPSKVTRKLVRASFKVTNDIYLEVLHLSLSCPITKQRLKLPCVSIKCEHLACFDGEAFLKVNKCRAIWHCPICNVVFDLTDLRVDSLISDIINQTNKDCLKISFDRNARWKPLEETPGKVSNRRASSQVTFSNEVIILDDNEKDHHAKIDLKNDKNCTNDVDDDSNVESSSDESDEFNNDLNTPKCDSKKSSKISENISTRKIQLTPGFPALRKSTDKVIEVITLDDTIS